MRLLTESRLARQASDARSAGRAGDAAAARDQFAALLPVRERVSGPEHPSTLAVRHNLAYWTGKAGDATGALGQFAALLPVRERVSGPEQGNSPSAAAAAPSRSHPPPWSRSPGAGGPSRRTSRPARP
jgi:hypothetical protein